MTLASRLRRCGTLALTVLLLLSTAAESTAQSLDESLDQSPAATSAADARPRLAVLPVATAAGVPSGAGPTLAGLLVAGIDTRRYALVERARAAQLLEETRLQDTELVDPATRAAELGRLVGLRYLVLGEVSDLGPLRWTARVIDCETGAIGARGSVRFENYHAADAAAAHLLSQLGLSVPGAATPSTAPVGHALMDARNPSPTVSLTLTTGEGRTDYLDGENISFRVRASADGYVTLVTVDAAGDLTLLLPNRWQPRAVVHAGEPITLPAPGAGFRFPAQAPHGRTVVKAVFTTRPLSLRGVDPARIESEGFIAGGNLNDGEKAIGLAAKAPAPEYDPGSRGTAATSDDAAPGPASERAGSTLPGFAPDEWATARLVLDTRNPGAADAAPFAATPGPSGPADAFAMRPDPVPHPSPSPIADPSPEAAAHARRAVYDAWQRVLGPGDTKAIEPTLPGPPAGDAWLIVRRARSDTKSLTGPDTYVTTVEHVPPADVKAIGEAALEAQLRQIRADDPGVVAALPNHGLISSFQVSGLAAGAGVDATADPKLSELQWPLANAFAPGLDTGWSRASARIAGIDPALIAVVDRGVYAEDPRLRGALWTNPGEVPDNGVDDDGNGYIDDVHGWDPHTQSGVLHARQTNPNLPAPFNHGHFCASIIAGHDTNARDVNEGNTNPALRGFAPRAKVLTAVGAANDPGRADDGLRGLISALRYSAANGAKVINLSLGNDPAQFRFTPALAAEYRRLPVWEELERAGVLLVCAAGNAHHDNDTDPIMPASLGRPNVISVMAIDPAGQPGHRYDPASARWKPYSNYGATTVHLAAPGSYVLGAPAPGRVGTAAESCGTSFATPLVSAAAALVWGQHPEWDAVTVRQALLDTTRPLPALRGRCVTGGTLDIDAALHWTP